MKTDTIEVNASALRDLLQAVIGPPHLIREIQATRSLHAMGPEYANPIETLLADVLAHDGRAAGTTVVAAPDAGHASHGSGELAPCPFCNGGQTMIEESKGVWNGSGFGEPVSVSVRHWCDPVPGQPNRMIERIGRDRASAIAAWNMRGGAVQKP